MRRCERIAQPAYDEDTIAHEFEYVATKLDLTVDELQRAHERPEQELSRLQVTACR